MPIPHSTINNAEAVNKNNVSKMWCKMFRIFFKY